MASKVSRSFYIVIITTVYSMGAEASGGVSPDLLRSRHWSRDISKLFTSAKMVDPVSCAPAFFTSIISDSGALFYCAISQDGQVFAISHDTLAHEFVLQLDCTRVTSVQRLRRGAALICGDDLVIALSITNGHLDHTPLHIPHPLIALPFRDKFIVITSDCACYLCEHSGHSDILWQPQNAMPLSATVSEPRGIIFVSVDGRLFTSRCVTGVEVTELSAPGLKHLATFDDDTLVGIDASTGVLVNLAIADDHSACEVTKLVEQAGITDISVCDRSVFCVTRSKVIVWDAEVGVREKTLPVSDPAVLLACPEGHVGVVISRNAEVVVFRLQISDPTEVIEGTFNHKVQLAKLPGLHGNHLLCGATCGDEFSFMTCDQSGLCILWESIPDWWDAPFVKRNLFL